MKRNEQLTHQRIAPVTRPVQQQVRRHRAARRITNG